MSDSRDCKQIKLDAEVEPQTGDDSVDNNDVQSDFSELTTLERQPKYSCWDKIDLELSDMEESIGDQVYVHREILDWILKIIDKHILSDKYRATAAEVFHHNLDSPVFLIKFYRCNSASKSYESNTPEFRKAITTIKELLQYKMSWQPNPKYFVRIDSNFLNRKTQITNDLQRINLLGCLSAKILHVDWMFTPKIEVFEFPEFLTQEQFDNIDSIFITGKSHASIYISEQFVWHKEIKNFHNVDIVAMDICAKEWHRCDLLKDFRLADILNIDMANKDYRDPYFNEYLGRYLDIILERSLPMLFAEHNEKFEVNINHLDLYIQHYFVARFYRKIALTCDRINMYSHPLAVYDVTLVRRRRQKFFLLDNQKIPPTLLSQNLLKNLQLLEVLVSNYAYFSDPLFRTWLDNLNEVQKYYFKFDKEFIFNYQENELCSQELVKDCNWMIGNKAIVIELSHCTEKNAVNLTYFVKYLFKLFKRREQLEIKVTLCFKNCVLEDYCFLENIGSYIQKVKFRRMIFSSQQLSTISRVLGQQRRCVKFVNCKGIVDTNVMTLLENIAFDDLYIERANSCTPIVYLLMAEYLMAKEGVDTIRGNRFLKNMKDCCSGWNLELVDFKKIVTDNGDKMIIVRNRNSEEDLDLYCFVKRARVNEFSDTGVGQSYSNNPIGTFEN